MAEETQVTLFDFQIRDNDIIERLAAIKKETIALKAANKELSKDYEKNASAISKNELALGQLSKEERNLKTVAEQSTAARKAQTGSIEEQRNRLALLTRQYNALGKQERDNAKIGGVLRKEIDSLTRSLKENSTPLEKQRLEIGNYKEAFADAIAGADGFGQKIVNVFQIIKSNPIGLLASAVAALFAMFTTNNRVIDFFSQKFGFVTKLFTVAGNNISKLEPVVRKVFDTFTSAIENPRQALEAITDFIKDQFQKRIESIGKAFDAIRNFSFDDVTGSLKRMADAGLQAVTGVENLTDKIASGAKAVSDYAAELKRGAQALADLDRAEERINRRRALNEAQSKALIRDEEALKNIRDDEFKTVGARLAANQRLFKLEEERNKTALQDARDLLAIEEKRVLETLRQRGVQVQSLDNLSKLKKLAEDNLLTEEEINKLGERRQQVYELEEESIGRINEFITNNYQLVLDGLNQTAEAQQKIANDRIAALERELLKVEANSERELELQQDLVKQKAKLDLIALNLEEKTAIEYAKRRGESVRKVNELFANRRKLVIETVESQIDRLQADYAAKQYERDKQSIADFEKLQAERLQKYKDQNGAFLQELDRFNAARNLATKRAINDGVKDQEQANDEALQSELQDLQIRLEANRNYQEKIRKDALLSSKQKQDALLQAGDEEVQIQSAIEDKKLEITKKGAERQKQILDANFSAISGFTSAVGSAFELLASNQEEATELQKIAALAQIAIDTAKAISSLVAASSQNPLNGVTAGAAGVAQFASGLAQILANIAQAKQLIAGFELGGVIDPRGQGVTLGGKRHAQGGTKILIEGQGMIEAEQGEILTIVKRTDSAKLSALSQMNVSRGGVSFMEQGGIASINRAITNNSGSQLVNSYSFDYTELAKAFAALPAPEVSVTTISRKQADVARVKVRGDIKPGKAT